MRTTIETNQTTSDPKIAVVTMGYSSVLLVMRSPLVRPVRHGHGRTTAACVPTKRKVERHLSPRTKAVRGSRPRTFRPRRGVDAPEAVLRAAGAGYDAAGGNERSADAGRRIDRGGSHFGSAESEISLGANKRSRAAVPGAGPGPAWLRAEPGDRRAGEDGIAGHRCLGAARRPGDRDRRGRRPEHGRSRRDGDGHRTAPRGCGRSGSSRPRRSR